MTDKARLGRPPHPSASHRLSQASLSRISLLLSTAAFAAPTVVAYTTAATRYHAHCRHHGHHASSLELDRCVCEYICSLFDYYHGRNRQLAVNTVFGVYMLCPGVRGRLRASEQMLRGWKRLAPSKSYRPLTWPIAVALARTMAASGYAACAVATLVAFDGLLRVGELVAISMADVSFPDDDRRGAAPSSSRQLNTVTSVPSQRSTISVFIRLAVTKTGAIQTAEISNPDVVALLRRWVSSRASLAAGADRRLFSFVGSSPADYFRAVMRATCRALDLDGLAFTPHSLRHGGATHAHVHMGLSIEHVLHRSRWKSNSSARTYLQSGTAALITTQLSDCARRHVIKLQAHWLAALLEDCFRQGP